MLHKKIGQTQWSQMWRYRAWQNNGVRKKTLFVKFDCHNDTATVDLFADSEGHNLNTFKRSYHKNISNEDVKKIIVILEGKWILF